MHPIIVHSATLQRIYWSNGSIGSTDLLAVEGGTKGWTDSITR